MLRFLFNAFLSLLLIAFISAVGVFWYLVPQIPSLETLKDVRLQAPLKVYTRDHSLIAEFGEKHRNPIKLKEVPGTLIKAVLAAEDDRFYDHPGVDWQGILRAAFYLARTGEKVQGGSTITMQVARNFFLSREKTYLRKLNEILLALKIERELGKDQILELYLNKIYFGHRAYGVAAAAEVYYGVELKDLTLPEVAMIAGLPKAPSVINPVTNPRRALDRRNYVLNRMLALGYITEKAHEEAIAAKNTASLHHGQRIDLSAPYVAEMARSYMVERYGKQAYEAGYRVITTLRDHLQIAANEAVHTALINYDRRHGYRGAEHHFTLSKGATDSEWGRLLGGFHLVGDLYSALVIDIRPEAVNVFTKELGIIPLKWSAFSEWRRYINENRRGFPPRKFTDIVKVGDVIRIQRVNEDGWRLAQVPAVAGALVSMDPRHGDLFALVGGFDFFHSKFNRATQARRQPGSGFKPFIYSAAINAGYTAASFIDDAPIEIPVPELDMVWRPQNYTRNFRGPMRLREALAQSRNLVSVRLLQAIGINKAVRHISRFGYSGEQLPRNFSLALGTGVMTPLELASGYAVFASGGFRVEPNFIDRIETSNGEVVVDLRHLPRSDAEREEDLETAAEAQPETAGAEPSRKRVISAQNAYIINSMLQDVIRSGTGKAAKVLGRSDLSGKTGTTNDQRDSWFTGYNSQIVTTAWMGFDSNKPLGNNETGARLALPMWIQFMKTPLQGMPESPMKQPPGLVTVRIDPKTGLQTSAGNPGGIFEVFIANTVPRKQVWVGKTGDSASPADAAPQSVTEKLF